MKFKFSQHLTLAMKALDNMRPPEKTQGCICCTGDPCDYHAATCVVCYPRCQGHPSETNNPLRQYDRIIPGFANILTLEEWQEWVATGNVMSYDGTGYWCKDGKESRDEVFSTPHQDATHVAWYNK